MLGPGKSGNNPRNPAARNDFTQSSGSSQARRVDKVGFTVHRIRRSSRLSKSLSECEILRVYQKLAVSKPDECAMLHPANDFDLQSEILSGFRPRCLVHKSSSHARSRVRPRQVFKQLTSTKPNPSVEHFAGSQPKAHHEIEWFFPTTAASRGDNAIVVREVPGSRRVSDA